MSESLITIIVRTKDRPKLLKRALRSIFAQTYRPIEVVLVNDGGCDLDTAEITSILGDVFLNYIKLEKNMGRAQAGNVGLENAKGKYVGFLDDDDEFYPDHIETLVTFLAQSDYKVAYTDSAMVFREYDDSLLTMTELSREVLFSRDFDYDFLLFENYIPLMCLLFEREVLAAFGGFDTRFELYEDWDLLMRTGEKFPFYHIKKTTADYIQWASDQQISQRNRNVMLVEKAYEEILSAHAYKLTAKTIHNYISGYVRSRNRIREKDASLRSRDACLRNLETVVAERDQRIENLSADLNARYADLNARNSELLKIYSSRGWKVLLTYYRIRDTILPENSKRELFLHALKNPKRFFQRRSRNSLQNETLAPVSQCPTTATGLYKDETFEVSLSGSQSYLQPPGDKTRVLVIDWMVPTPDKDSGSLRMFILLSLMNEMGYKVTFLPDDLTSQEPYVTELIGRGIEVLCGNVDAEAFLKEQGHLFSLVIMSRPDEAFKYLPLVRAYAIYSKVIYDTVDLHWIRFGRAAAVTGNAEFAQLSDKYRPLELFNASCCDMTVTVTAEDRRALLQENPSLKIEVVPNIHDVVPVRAPFNCRKDVMFIGGFHHEPNEDAVIYFVRQIFPLVREMVPGTRFFVVGSNPSLAVQELKSDDIVVTGYVKDVSPYFSACRVFVSPLRYGAGLKGKIGQSMSFGLPVVTTTVGAEGFGLVDGETALIADDAAAFAEATRRLYTNEQIWERISNNSIDYIEKNYSREATRQKLEHLFKGIREEEECCVA